jgi:hypothetical protein
MPRNGYCKTISTPQLILNPVLFPFHLILLHSSICIFLKTWTPPSNSTSLLPFWKNINYTQLNFIYVLLHQFLTTPFYPFKWSYFVSNLVRITWTYNYISIISLANLFFLLVLCLSLDYLSNIFSAVFIIYITGPKT